MLQGEVEVGWLQMSFIRPLHMDPYCKCENWSDLECIFVTPRLKVFLPENVARGSRGGMATDVIH